ncbi:MAG: amidinotransferase, partial [Chloroflexi bacterium]
MNRPYGCQDMVSPLRTVLVKRPDQAFGAADPQVWHYTSRPDLAVAQQEHDTLVELLRKGGAEVIYQDEYLPDHADAIYAFDPSLVTDSGAIILSMGKDKRRGEEAAMARTYEKMDIPILYTLHGEARAEGGDLLWVDH